MKGTLIAILFVGCAGIVKAQQVPVFPKQQPLQNLHVLPDSFSVKKLDSLSKLNPISAVPLNKLSNINTHNMPVVRTQGSSKMPVVQTDATAYNMPMVGMSMPRVYIMNKLNEQKPVAPANNNDVK